MRRFALSVAAALAFIYATAPASAVCHLAPLKTYKDCPKPRMKVEIHLPGSGVKVVPPQRTRPNVLHSAPANSGVAKPNVLRQKKPAAQSQP
jgi:hypothetical protein